MEIKIYSTSEYYLAVALTCLGFNLISIDRSDPHKSIFKFESSSKLEKNVDAYYRGLLKLDPRMVLLQAKLVKNRLYGNQ